jgi:hypothetical protein
MAVQELTSYAQIAGGSYLPDPGRSIRRRGDNAPTIGAEGYRPDGIVEPLNRGGDRLAVGRIPEQER